MKIIKFFKYGFTVIGLCLLAAALFLYLNQKAFISKAALSEGTVIGLAERSDTDLSVTSIYYYPMVEFHTRTNERIEFLSSSGTNPPSYRKGEKVEVLYLPNEPQNAFIKGFFSLWGAALIIGGVGGMFLLIGGTILGVSRFKSSRDNYLKQKGARIETEFMGVEINKRIEVNGRNPYRVLTQWQNPATGELITFKSNDLWSDPSNHILGRKITVFMERNNPKKHYVDLSFLPGDGKRRMNQT